MDIITYKVELSPDVVVHTCNACEAKARGLPWVQRVIVSSRPTWVTDQDPILKTKSNCNSNITLCLFCYTI